MRGAKLGGFDAGKGEEPALEPLGEGPAGRRNRIASLPVGHDRLIDPDSSTEREAVTAVANPKLPRLVDCRYADSQWPLPTRDIELPSHP